MASWQPSFIYREQATQEKAWPGQVVLSCFHLLFHRRLLLHHPILLLLLPQQNLKQHRGVSFG